MQGAHNKRMYADPPLPLLTCRVTNYAGQCYVSKVVTRRGHAALYSSSQVDEPEPQAWHRRAGFKERGILTGLNDGGVGEVFFRKSLGPTSGAV
jgi:hypothetical protein